VLSLEPVLWLCRRL